ncbi:hypothetical protein OAS86_00455 [Gammaproteobacteria bacterium]|nr:hypothetical protein [Gammaproteobacteria bacterium]
MNKARCLLLLVTVLAACEMSPTEKFLKKLESLEIGKPVPLDELTDETWDVVCGVHFYHPLSYIEKMLDGERIVRLLREQRIPSMTELYSHIAFIRDDEIISFNIPSDNYIFRAGGIQRLNYAWTNSVLSDLCSSFPDTAIVITDEAEPPVLRFISE